MRIVFVFLLCSFSVVLFSQSFQVNETIVPVEYQGRSGYYAFVENMPQFAGGIEELQKFIADNIVYPDSARALKVEGDVYVQFVVRNNGTIDEVAVVRSVHPLLDDEAVRVIKAMPQWKPGYQDGKAVNVVFTQPIRFKLSAEFR